MDLSVLMQTVPVGDYFSVVKIITLLVISVIWWRLLTWLDKDTVVARLPREWINLGMVGGYILAFVLFIFIPGFGLAFTVFILLLLAEIGTYTLLRNQSVGLQDLVGEIKGFNFAKLWGGSGKAKKEDYDEVPGMVTLTTRDGRHISQPAFNAPERQAYDVVQLMLTEPLRRGMERLELVPVDGSMMVQYWVDGVVYSGPQFNKAGIAVAITLLKRIANLDINEKRKPQVGSIGTLTEGKKHEVQVHVAGSTSGESLRLVVDPKRRHELKIEQVGFSPDQMSLVQAVIGVPDGVVLVAVPKGQGLTSLLYAIIRQHDAFLTHIHTIEREPEYDLEGVTQNKLSRAATAADELASVQWVVSQEPDAVLVPEIQNPMSVRDLIGYAVAGKRVYLGLRSPSAIEAINDWRKLVGDDDMAMRSLRMVIAGRVVRKLCPACKQPYQPDPDTLRKLNLDHGKAQQFFQARTQAVRDNKGNAVPCTFCADMHYKGRTGVFEVMEINDDIRQAVITNASVNQLRALFRKMRGRFVQEQAMDLVEQGITSIQEVLRSMRGQEQDPHAAKTAAAAASGTMAMSSSGTTPSANQAPRSGRPPASGGH